MEATVDGSIVRFRATITRLYERDNENNEIRLFRRQTTIHI